jgi:hypothetical protein
LLAPPGNGTSSFTDAGQQPAHYPLVRILDGRDSRRYFGRKGRSLVFTLPSFFRKGHPFANDCSANLMFWHHDRTPSSGLNEMALTM